MRSDAMDYFLRTIEMDDVPVDFVKKIVHYTLHSI